MLGREGGGETVGVQERWLLISVSLGVLEYSCLEVLLDGEV